MNLISALVSFVMFNFVSAALAAWWMRRRQRPVELRHARFIADLRTNLHACLAAKDQEIEQVRITIEQNHAVQGQMIAEELKLLRDQNEDVKKIAQYLGTAYRLEIQNGLHTSRPLSSIIIGYLERERAHRNNTDYSNSASH